MFIKQDITELNELFKDIIGKKITVIDHEYRENGLFMLAISTYDKQIILYYEVEGIQNQVIDRPSIFDKMEGHVIDGIFYSKSDVLHISYKRDAADIRILAKMRIVKVFLGGGYE